MRARKYLLTLLKSSGRCKEAFVLLALFSDLQLLFDRLLTRLNGGNSISLESFEILSPSSIHPLFLTLPGKYQEYSHCYFTILNHRKKVPV